MDQLRQPTAAAILIALSLWIQCAGMSALINWGLAYLAREHRLSLLRSTVLIVRVTGLMMDLHLVQILVWAAFYRWMCFPGWGHAFYFSIASYSTLGSNDLALPVTWRSLGPVEAVTGMLMCGLSVSLLFAIVTRLVDRVVISSRNVSPVAGSLRGTTVESPTPVADM